MKICVRVALSLALAVMTLVSAGCSAYDGFKAGFFEEKQDAIKIGVFEPLSGEYKKFGMLEWRGIQLAHEQAGEVNGKKVVLVSQDNESDTIEAEKVAQKLVQEKVLLVLGSYGSALSIAGANVFQKAEIAQINVSSSNPLVTQGGDYTFSVCITESFQAVMAAKYVYEKLETEKATVIKCKNDDRSAALTQAFCDKMVQLTGDAASTGYVIEYPEGTTDYSEQIKLLAREDTSVVYLPGNAEESAELIRQARAKGLTQTFLGSDEWDNPEFLKIGGDVVEGVTFTCYYDAEDQQSEQSEAFLKAYHKKYGEDKTPDQAEALGYDAYMLAVNAIERAEEETSQSVREAVRKTWNFQGATGSISFGENGEPTKSVMFKTVKNGECIHEYTAEPAWN